jgi:tetratricopeptide (TPR) repeat protein
MMKPGLLSAESLTELAIAVSELSSEEGIARLDEMLTRYGSDARLHFLRASLLADLKDFSAALKGFAEAVRLDPDFEIGRFQYGLLLYTGDQFAEAREVWRDLDKLPDSHCLRLFKTGLCLLIDGQAAEGLDLLRAGQAVNSEFPALNHDMQLVINAATAALDVSADLSANAHLLLSGYAASSSKH